MDVNVQLFDFSKCPARRNSVVISITAEYALRATVFLARNVERAHTTRQIADATRVPSSYLSKVLQLLTKGGVIRSVRGIYGGYQLAHAPDKLTALAVINSVDPIQRVQGCPLGLPEHSGELCPLHERIDAAIALSEQAFANTTLAELLPPGATTACAFPQAILDATVDAPEPPSTAAPAAPDAAIEQPDCLPPDAAGKQ